MDDRINELEETVELLRQQLEEVTGTSRELGALMALRYGMTQCLATMLFILVKRAPAVVSKSVFHSVIYGDRVDGGPEPKIFAVRINKLRGVLTRLGEREGRNDLKIDTVWSAGYRASPALVKWVHELYSRELPKGE